MTNWTFYKDPRPNLFDADKALTALTDSLPGFKEKWNEYLLDSYKEGQRRLYYVDIGYHAHYICDSIIAKNTDEFEIFFETLEQILNHCDDATENLMAVGLIEGIQNVCSGENINIWTGFDRWLKPTTKKLWDGLIMYWEGADAIEKYKAKHPGYNALLP